MLRAVLKSRPARDRIQARIAEIMRAGAERAEITIEKVLRELAVLGFSDIGKVVRWRPEVVYEEIEDEDNPDKPPRQVLQSRVLVLDSATLPPEVRLAVAEVSQSPNGALRVKMHDKHGPAGFDRQASRHVRQPPADTRAQADQR